MSAAPSASFGPRQIDLRAEHARRQELIRTRALDARSLPQAKRETAEPITQLSDRFMAGLIISSFPRPKRTKQRLRTRYFGLHIASIGLIAGMAAILLIVFMPAHLPKQLAPIVGRHGTTPSLGRPAQTSLAKAVTAPAKPTDRLVIPSANINASVTEVGLTKDNALDAPKTMWQVAHYSGSPEPGQPGTAIIDGHSGAPDQYGVLEDLSMVKIGATISYRYVNGAIVNFKVISSAAYPDTTDAAKVLFAKTTGATLNLVSCYGHWDAATKNYDQRWIVKAELVQ